MASSSIKVPSGLCNGRIGYSPISDLLLSSNRLSQTFGECYQLHACGEVVILSVSYGVLDQRNFLACTSVFRYRLYILSSPHPLSQRVCAIFVAGLAYCDSLINLDISVRVSRSVKPPPFCCILYQMVQPPDSSGTINITYSSYAGDMGCTCLSITEQQLYWPGQDGRFCGSSHSPYGRQSPAQGNHPGIAGRLPASGVIVGN